MSLGIRDGAPPRPTLKLFLGSETDHEARVGPTGLSPEMTLPEFFEAWYVPVILKTTGAKPQSIELLRTTLRWWQLLTRDPPLRLIDDFAVAEFAAGLRAATYRRGKLGRSYPLSATTISNHLRHVRWILSRTGARSASQPQAAGLVDPPHVPQKPPPASPKRSFTTSQWQALFAVAQQWQRPRSQLVPAPLFWQALYCLLFYTGFRIGTILKLRWDHLVEEDDVWWIDVPAAIVEKTEKATKRVVHPTLWAALALVRQTDLPQLVPFGVHDDTLDKYHRQMQSAIGLARPMGWNVWRRTHTAELARLGYQQTVKLLQQALDHSDSSTTTNHYYDPLNDFIRRMPSVELAQCDRQLTLF